MRMGLILVAFPMCTSLVPVPSGKVRFSFEIIQAENKWNYYYWSYWTMFVFVYVFFNNKVVWFTIKLFKMVCT